MRTVSRLIFGLIFLFAASRVTLAGPAALPTSLEVPANQTLALTLTARGVQIYEYRATPNESGKFEWVFKAPEADLVDTQGRKVGRHYAGPTWELNEGGKVVGKVKAKAEAPDGNGIPWLLLDVMQASGPVLGKIVSVQRVDTVGGKAPAGTDAATPVGSERRMDYTATYKFYVVKP